MTLMFYIAAIIAILSTVLAITSLNAIHALLYLNVSFLAVSLVFFVIGAPFIAALEVIVYAGAIVVLFVFVVMMLNQGHQSIEQERDFLCPSMFTGPGVLFAILFVELRYVFWHSIGGAVSSQVVSPKEVGITLYGPYVIGVELVSVLLLAGLIGAYHLGYRNIPEQKGIQS